MPNPPKKLVDYIIATDSLPDDDLTLEKIVERGYGFKEVEDGVFEFLIVRDPGLLGMSSRGKGFGLAAYWKEKTTYRVNLKTHEWSAEVLSRKLSYDVELLASVEIVGLEDGGVFSKLKPDKSNVDEVIENAVRITSRYYSEMKEDGCSDEEWSKMIRELEIEMRKQLSDRFN